VQRDVVLRWIEQIAKVVAGLLTGNRDQIAAARDQIDEAGAALLGPLQDLVPRLEPESAADLLHDSDRIYAWGRLLALRAACEQAAGNDAHAQETRGLARAMVREAIRRSPEPRPEWNDFADAMDADGTG
jgi:hypothetical protein